MMTDDVQREGRRVRDKSKTYSALLVDFSKHLIGLIGRDLFTCFPVRHLYFHEDLVRIVDPFQKPGRHMGYLVICRFVAEPELFSDLTMIGHDRKVIDGQLGGLGETLRQPGQGISGGGDRFINEVHGNGNVRSVIFSSTDK